jgi:hypothetical protein
MPARSADLRFHLLLLVAAVALGSTLQSFGPSWTRAIFEQVQLDSLSGLSALLLALLASIMAHELGHLIAARAFNYEILGGAIGPFQLDRWHNQCIFRLRAGQWSRCSISAVPRRMHSRWRIQMMLVVLAGPVASWLFLAVAVSLAAGHDAVHFWSACAEVNFFLVMLGFIPNSRLAPIRNDAALFLALWKNADDAQDIFRCHQAIELGLRGIRPEDFPEPLLHELAAFEQGRPYTRLMVARRMVEWAVDSGHLELAREWDQEALEASAQCGPRSANRALAESACLDVGLRRDLVTACRKFAKVRFAELFPPSLAERAQAAYLVARHLPQQAPAHILRAQYQLPLGNPYYNFERMLLEQLHHLALAQNRAATRAAAT